MPSSAKGSHTGEQVAEVLQLVVEHAPAASDVKVLCTLLQVSRTVQRAIRNSMGYCSLVLSPLGLGGGTTSMKQMALIASSSAWLTHQPGLVTKLTFSGPLTDAQSSSSTSQALVAQQLVGFALQLCEAQAKAHAAVVGLPSSSSASSSSAAAATVPWRLRSVVASRLLSTAILHSLGACTSLTMLDLELSRRDAQDRHLLMHLSHLVSLRHLEARGHLLSGRFVAGISKLPRLEHLVLHAPLLVPTAARLPRSLRGLTAVLRAVHSGQAEAPTVNMGYLVLLRELFVTCLHGVSSASVLPPNITQLKHVGALLPMAGLQLLEALHLPEAKDAVPFLNQLSALPHLNLLELGVARCAEGELRQIFKGIAGAQQLTKLVLTDPSAKQADAYTPSPYPLQGVELHPQLQKLTTLQHLDISSLDIQAEDAMHFTALKSLTALQLYNCWSISDTAVAAIACHLSNLRMLELIDCNLDSPVIWPAIGMCTTLESLCIDSHPNNVMRLHGSALHLLTGLTRLSALVGPVLEEVTPEEYSSFQAALPTLQSLPSDP